MACCESVRRTFPMNFIFLAIFTLAESFLLGMITASYAQFEVFLAVGITAAVCLGLTLFAFQTKWYVMIILHPECNKNVFFSLYYFRDFTMMGGKR